MWRMWLSTTIVVFRKYYGVVLALFFFLCIGYFLLNYKPSKTQVSKSLEQIPFEEREALSFFFYDLMRSGGAYVLFGDKPMAFTGYYTSLWNQDHIYSLTSTLHPENLKIKKGWEVWQKYRSLFPSSRYVIRSAINPFHEANLFLIDQKKCLSTIQLNLEDFKSILGQQTNPNAILKQIQEDPCIEEVLKYHEGLFGTLLGFGKNNSWLFHRRKAIERVLFPKSFGANFWQTSFLYTQLQPNLGFSTLYEEWVWLNDHLTNINGDQSICDINILFLSLPGFVTNPQDPETQELSIRYSKTLKKILRAYQGRDFLEVTLERYCLN